MQRHVDFPNPDLLGDCARPVLTNTADGRLLTLVRLLARQAAHECTAMPGTAERGGDADA